MLEVDTNEINESMTIFKILRLLSGLSGKRFAKICGLSYPYWYELENGIKDNPSRTVINKIADVSGLKPETLWYLAGTGQPKTSDIQKLLISGLEDYAKELMGG